MSDSMWIYKSHPVLLPANSTFDMKLQFGGWDPLPLGTEIRLQHELPGMRRGRIVGILEKEKAYDVELVGGVRLPLNHDVVERVTDLELLAEATEPAPPATAPVAPDPAAGETVSAESGVTVKVTLLGRYSGIVTPS